MFGTLYVHLKFKFLVESVGFPNVNCSCSITTCYREALFSTLSTGQLKSGLFYA